MTTKTISQVDTYAEQAVEWDGKRAEAEQELAALQERSGRAALDDPKALDALARDIAEARERVGIAARAADEARRRAQDARSAEFSKAADDLLPALAKAQKAIEAHDARTTELLKTIQEHTGETYAPFRDDLRLPAQSRRSVLQGALADLKRQREALLNDAERTAADPSYVPPQEVTRRRYRADWDESIKDFRDAATEYGTLLPRIAEKERQIGFDPALDGATVPATLAPLYKRRDDLLDLLGRFDDNADFFAEQFAKVGISLSDEEIDTLRSEIVPQAKVS